MDSVLVLLFLAAVVFSPHDAPTQRLRALVREVKRDGTKPPRVHQGKTAPVGAGPAFRRFRGWPPVTLLVSTPVARMARYQYSSRLDAPVRARSARKEPGGP